MKCGVKCDVKSYQVQKQSAADPVEQPPTCPPVVAAAAMTAKVGTDEPWGEAAGPGPAELLEDGPSCQSFEVT